jgi:hypothetical protein
VLALAAGHAERLLDVAPARGAGGCQLVGDRRQVLDLEADVMDPREALAALDTRRPIVLELEDREVDVAVAQEAPRGTGVVDLPISLMPKTSM